MSLEALTIALHHSKAKGTTKLVLLGIANHDSDGGAWPSIGTLAVYADIDDSNVRRHIKALEDLGEVSVVFNGGGTERMAQHMRPNLYQFELTCPADCDRTKAHRLLCDLCNDPLPNDRRKAGAHKEGMCCPLSGQLGKRSCRQKRGYHSPEKCGYSLTDDEEGM
jgi:Helix-turn-helix domain